MSVQAVVLAAGKGTRMRSSLPKVLHLIAGRSMLDRVLDTLAQVGLHRPVVVAGYGRERIEAAVGTRGDLVDQGEQLGTGHAMRVGLEAVAPAVERVVVLHGDEPLIPADALQRMMALQRDTGAPVVLLTTEAEDTRAFGRVVRDTAGTPVALVQESDLTPAQRAIHEVNLGAYVFDAGFLRRALPSLAPHPPKGEYYLTDLIAVAAADPSLPPAQAVTIPGGEDVLGVNDLAQLEQAGRAVFRATNRRLMEQGVTIVDSASTFIDETVRIEPDTVVHPFSVLSGDTHIGAGCSIGPGAHIIASRIGAACTVLSSTVEHAEVAEHVRIGPYSHLRPGARIGANCEIGNYAEIKASSVGPGTRMHHMSYLGDAVVGANVNIGAGTITCNYDGRAKHRTIIGDGAFIGSDTMLRAPIEVGAGAYTGAGSVVTRDVPAGALVAGVPAKIRQRASVEPEAGEEADETREQGRSA